VSLARNEPFQILLGAGGSDFARLQTAAELVEEEWQFFALIDYSVCTKSGNYYFLTEN
jgi:hypothetical protein